VLVAALPDLEREIVVLRFFEVLDQDAIAARIGYSQMHVSRLGPDARRTGGMLTAPARSGFVPKGGTSMEIMRMVLMTGLLVAIGVLVLVLVARAGHGPALPSARPGPLSSSGSGQRQEP